MNEPIQSKQYYRQKVEKLQEDLRRAEQEREAYKEKFRVSEDEVGRLEGELESMTADRNMTMAELELYWELTTRMRRRWWWRLFAQPIVDAMKLENAEARRAIR